MNNVFLFMPTLILLSAFDVDLMIAKIKTTPTKVLRVIFKKICYDFQLFFPFIVNNA